ncbi:membrane protein insertion efficiency factor YidD [Psychrobacter aestuarii]|uniref:membrane protein insertion efficiency factor YidD n=1 Tax=Psychrobacter aestuarii TaxID=556327 RepID=UPI0019196271|nr:membrane protein insertion efficiency factor YidD [Psychrobacter aestuarii]
MFLFFYYLILFYQKVISPLLPARCRYYPTCSAYGMQAIKWHGGVMGSKLLLMRLARCHPLGGHGVDFVPLPLYAYRYQYLPIAQDVKTTRYGYYHCVFVDRYSYKQRLNCWLMR